MQTLPRKTPQPLERKPMKTPIETKSGDGRREYRSCSIQFKAADDGSVDGYASVFDIIDSYDDIIRPGAFLKTLAEHKTAGTMPAMFLYHDEEKPCGAWQVGNEDAKGLFIAGKLLLDIERGQEARALIKIKAITGLSIGFVPREWHYEEIGGRTVRVLTDIELWEVSFVTFPANKESRITSIKSVTDELTAPKHAERTLRDAGFSKADATAFVSRVMRMGEERSDSAKSAAVALQAANRLLSSITSA